MEREIQILRSHKLFRNFIFVKFNRSCIYIHGYTKLTHQALGQIGGQYFHRWCPYVRPENKNTLQRQY